MKHEEHPVLLFDGVCNLCNTFIRFIIRHDPEHHFRFASLQSRFGEETLQRFHLPIEKYGSAVLLENGKPYTRSTAALRVIRKLNGAWPLLYALIIFPPFIRNAVYNLIARNRYKWFGKKEQCWIPTPELAERFID